MTSPRLLRFGYTLAAIVVGTAVAMQIAATVRTGLMHSPTLLMMTGLLILMVTGAADVPPGKLRNGLTGVALAGIMPGALLMLSGNH